MGRLLKVFFTISFLLFSHTGLSANLGCNYSNDEHPVFSFLQQNDNNGEYRSKVANACLGNRDVTSWIADSKTGVVTSSIKPNKNMEFFYVTTFDPQTDKSMIVAVYLLSNGQPMKKTLMVGNRNYENPKALLREMLLEGFDELHKVLYFSVPAWATSDAIHSFSVPVDMDARLLPIKPIFVTDGNYKYMNVLVDECRGCIAVTKIKHDDVGAYFPVFMIDWKGNTVCQLDTKTEEFGDLKCLPAGVDFRPR